MVSKLGSWNAVFVYFNCSGNILIRSRVTFWNEIESEISVVALLIQQIKMKSRNKKKSERQSTHKNIWKYIYFFLYLLNKFIFQKTTYRQRKLSLEDVKRCFSVITCNFTSYFLYNFRFNNFFLSIYLKFMHLYFLNNILITYSNLFWWICCDYN